MTNLNDMSLEELEKAKQETEQALRDAEFQAYFDSIKSDPEKLLQLVNLIEAVQRTDIESRQAEVAAKFANEGGTRTSGFAL